MFGYNLRYPIRMRRSLEGISVSFLTGKSGDGGDGGKNRSPSLLIL
jgi:hypothetical protein